MSVDLYSGLDFFSSILEAPVYVGESASEISISTDDMEKLDIFGTGSYEKNIYLIIGNDISSRETVRCVYTRAVDGDDVTRTLRLDEALIYDHDIGEEIYCGTTFRYIDNLNTEVTEIDSTVTEISSTVEELESTVSGYSESISELEESVEEITSLVGKQSIHVDLSNGDFSGLAAGSEIYLEDDDVSVTPLVYEVPAICGQLLFSLPENNEEESQEYILLDFTNVPVSNIVVFQTSNYDPAEGTYPHKLAFAVYNSSKERVYYTFTFFIEGSTFEYLAMIVLDDVELEGGKAILPVGFIAGLHMV